MSAVTETQLEAAIDEWVTERYSRSTLAGGTYNMHSTEGPPALKARLLEDIKGVLEVLDRAPVA